MTSLWRYPSIVGECGRWGSGDGIAFLTFSLSRPISSLSSRPLPADLSPEMHFLLSETAAIDSVEGHIRHTLAKLRPSFGSGREPAEPRPDSNTVHVQPAVSSLGFSVWYIVGVSA